MYVEFNPSDLSQSKYEYDNKSLKQPPLDIHRIWRL